MFADALDEARAAGHVDGKRKMGGEKRHLVDLEVSQLKQAESIRRRLDRLLRLKGIDWIPDQAFIEAHKSATQTISTISRSLRLAKQAEREHRSKLSDDELDQAFIVELRRIATRLTEQQWRALLVAGMGADIAEAAIAVWKKREADAVNGRARTQFVEGNPGRPTP